MWPGVWKLLSNAPGGQLLSWTEIDLEMKAHGVNVTAE